MQLDENSPGQLLCCEERGNNHQSHDKRQIRAAGVYESTKLVTGVGWFQRGRTLTFLLKRGGTVAVCCLVHHTV